MYSSSGVSFVVSTHLSINVLRLSSIKFDEAIEDFFFPIKVVMLATRLSDRLDSSKILFLKLTVSSIEFDTKTSQSVAPNFFAKSRH